MPEAIARPGGRRGPQLIWIIPIVAALIGGGLAVNALLQRGPTITISFKTADGLQAGKTMIKFKDVEIGTVTAIDLAPDRLSVVATAELTKDSKDLLAEDTRFWVVRPAISGSSITGLSTLLSGAYIGLDVGKSVRKRRAFVGLEIPPIVTSGLQGREFVLHTEQLGSLGIGAPVYFRRIRVGEVVAYALDPGGKTVTLKAFINAPYDQYVTTSTRFWHASGIDVTLNASGIKVDTQSIATLIAGGIAFQAPPNLPVGEPAAVDAVFTLSATYADAMKPPVTQVQRFLLYFDQSVRGLSPGATVEYRGIPLGEVTAVGLAFDPDSITFRIPVEIAFYPERIQAEYRKGMAPATPASFGRTVLDTLIKRGLRAQLKTGSLLTGQLYVSLDIFPTAPKATLDWTQDPVVLPTTPGSLVALEEKLGGVVSKLEQVPVDKIGKDLQTTIETTNTLLARFDAELVPAARTTLQDASRVLGTAEGALTPDSLVQQNLRGALSEVSQAAAALRNLANYLEQHPESLIRGKPEDEQ
jgi:paraquat-inducible protein B